jgi:uncharacterized OsmC-like protein
MSTTVNHNGLNYEAVSGLASQIKAKPALSATTWRAAVRWNGAFRSEATVRKFAPIASDEPITLGGTDSAPNPVEQLLAALGNCLVVGYVLNASALGISITDLRISVEGDIDLHTFLNLAGGHAGYESIRVKVALTADADEAQRQALHKRVIDTSPVGHTLTRAIPVQVDLG